MLFAGKFAAPLADTHGVRQPVFERAVEEPLSLFAAPTGYFFADGLQALLDDQARPALWLRLGPEDQDPARFVDDLLASARRLSPDVGASTLALMRHRPGPVAGWPGLFSAAAQELSSALPAASVVVLQDLHQLDVSGPTLGLLSRYLLPALPSHVACILTADGAWPGTPLPAYAVRRGARELRLENHATLRMMRQAGLELEAKSLDRAARLADGCATVVAALCEAGGRLSPLIVRQAIEQARDLNQVLDRLGRAWLPLLEPESLAALALALHMGYHHPALAEAALTRTAEPTGPWLQPLTGGWARVRRQWLVPLRAALRLHAPDVNALNRAASYLLDQGATERAVALYLETGAESCAAQAMADVVDALLDTGEWTTLERWLQQLNDDARIAHPQLVYAEAELAAAQGRPEVSYGAFSLAAELFAARRDARGACLSLLAESALAAWHGHYTHAQTQALSAAVMAEAAGLPHYQGWANWQLGCLAAAAEDLDSAILYFGQAATLTAAAGESLSAEGLRHAEALARYWRELRCQSEFHRQAAEVAGRAERKAAERVRMLAASPSDHLDMVVGAHGWSNIPLMLKWPAPQPPALPQATPALPAFARWWQALQRWIEQLRPAGAPASGTDSPGALALAFPQPVFEARPEIAPPLAAAEEVPTSPEVAAEAQPTPLPESPAPATEIPAIPLTPSPPAAQSNNLPDEAPARPQSAPPVVEARLLGAFAVAVDGRPIERWPKGKAQAMLKYLLLQHPQPVLRDVLMDVFWPEVEPGSARNRLNVAMYSLRHLLRAVVHEPVVIFEDGAYGLSPTLQVSLDVDEFERQVQEGRHHETTGRLAAAIAAYERAISLYRDDLLPEDPYESWPVLARERLRVAYLDTLDRLSQIYFNRGEYDACAALCDRILSRDRCREDAHARLMRCYSRRGKGDLALRQYQTCVEALHLELDVDPTPVMRELYESIRRRERV